MLHNLLLINLKIFFFKRNSVQYKILHTCYDSQVVDRWFFNCSLPCQPFFSDWDWIAVSCICYQFHYSPGHICSCSPRFLIKLKTPRLAKSFALVHYIFSCSLRFLFKRKTCRCFSNELCHSLIIVFTWVLVMPSAAYSLKIFCCRR